MKLLGANLLFSPADLSRGGGGLSPAMLDQAVARALTLHQRGQLQQAGEAYSRVLAADPGHAEANHLLGLIWHQTGRNEEAASHIGKAVALVPGNAIYQTNLGTVFKALNRLEDAVASYQRALAIDPKLAQVHSNLGVALLALGRTEAAAEAQETALGLAPTYVEAYANLGLALMELGRRDEAMERYARAIALKPDYANAHNHLAVALAKSGRLEEARQSAERAVELRPMSAGMHHTLGGVLMEMGELEAAAESFRRAVQIQPDTTAYRNLGRVLADLGRHQDAASALTAAIAGDPADASAHASLGHVLHDMTSYNGAIESFRKAVELRPDDAQIRVSFGAALLASGRIEEAETAFGEALGLDSESLLAKSALLFVSNYRETSTAEGAAAEAKTFGEMVARAISPRTSFANTPDPEKRLRVGFVSGDFYEHPVAQFLKTALAALDREKLELFAYSTAANRDETTERLQAIVPNWRSVTYTSGDQLEAAILADGIDILIDLSGHTARNRLLVFARKPAPVTATWLGYSGTSGLKAMDYVIADRFVAPETAADQFSETPWRMPDSYLCFSPPEQAPEVAPLPALQNSFVTFGSFNNVNKLSQATLALWARVLAAVPNSRLLLKNKPLEKQDVAERIRETLAAAGADLSRVDLLGFVRDPGGHLGTYGRVDIGLDPFPYNGTTTSCEAMWMGVPVLTLAGDRFIARVGESVLNSAGLPDWVAADEGAYVAKAAAAAADLPGLAALRAGLRPQMAASPLCDAPRFARNFETALRGMWREWCDRNG
ncbi:MAG TPA: tetratricopeptide repeat protein [Devosiaceae bacterium]|nr:tetratricopeptide repeat protein [Devosiaceae bacterium]